MEFSREIPTRGLEGNPTFLVPLRESVATCSVSKATRRSLLACVAERCSGTGCGMFSVRSMRGPSLSSAGLAVLDRPVGSLSSYGFGKTSVPSEKREPSSLCASSTASGSKGSSSKVRVRVAERLGSENRGSSPAAKRACGGRGGRTGAPDNEGAGDGRRLSGGATAKEELDMSGPLLAVLARDTWSSGRSILVWGRSGASEVLLS